MVLFKDERLLSTPGTHFLFSEIEGGLLGAWRWRAGEGEPVRPGAWLLPRPAVSSLGLRPLCELLRGMLVKETDRHVDTSNGSKKRHIDKKQTCAQEKSCCFSSDHQLKAHLA
eukprot:1144156-Pelagomonas_calceolata.AAC.2